MIVDRHKPKQPQDKQFALYSHWQKAFCEEVESYTNAARVANMISGSHNAR